MYLYIYILIYFIIDKLYSFVVMYFGDIFSLFVFWNYYNYLLMLLFNNFIMEKGRKRVVRGLFI